MLDINELVLIFRTHISSFSIKLFQSRQALKINLTRLSTSRSGGGGHDAMV